MKSSFSIPAWISSPRAWTCALCLAALTVAVPLRAPARTTDAQPAALAGGFQNEGVIKGAHLYGTTRFSKWQILRASGLHIGEELTDARMNQAQQRLANTGAFTEVTVDDFPGMGGTVLHLTVHDMQPLAVCDFSGITGVDQKRLLAELKSSVPLFDGRVPVANPMMLNRVRARLRELLQRQGVKGKVADIIHLSQGAGPTRIEFRLLPAPSAPKR